MRCQVLVSLLVTSIFGNEMEVFAADDQRAVHLRRNDGASEDTATDRNQAGERALLVCKEESISLSRVFEREIRRSRVWQLPRC
jgi:hypothetical protein